MSIKQIRLALGYLCFVYTCFLVEADVWRIFVSHAYIFFFFVLVYRFRLYSVLATTPHFVEWISKRRKFTNSKIKRAIRRQYRILHCHGIALFMDELKSFNTCKKLESTIKNITRGY